MRPEIQALRAISVTTIIIFHYWHGLIPGGYIAVDIFFVISGFLITGQLVREADRTSTVSMTQFWARRARRILPASLFVLFVCAIATYLIVPLNLWGQFFSEIKASALYVENWNLAAQAVDYLGAENRPSPVQHYWTLSVEEQFYLIWPVLILIGAAIARKGSELARRRLIAVLLSLLTVASLIYSIVETGNDPAAAYFITPTRIWEFGAGGLLALISTELGREQLRAAVSWLGVTAIVASSFIYTAKTPYPGSAALVPVIGSLAVIWAGAPDVRWAPLFWMRLRWVQWVGDNSYSIYLWHWPLLILTPFLLLEELTTPIKFALIAIMLVLAWLTKRFVEDPIRSGPVLVLRPPRQTFIVAIGATAVVVVACFGALQVLQQRQQQDRLTTARLLSSGAPCLGAAARDPEHQPCVNPKLRFSVSPSPATARELVIPHDATAANKSPLCQGGLKIVGLLELCTFGVPEAKAKRQIVSIGDSHGRRWRPALNVAALQLGWRVTSIIRRSCPLSTYGRGTAEDRAGCKIWKRQLPAWLAKNPNIDTIFETQSAGKGKDLDTFPRQVAGYKAGFKMLPSSIKHIVVLRDNPRAAPGTLDCVERTVAAGDPTGQACALPRSQALIPDALAVAARDQHKPGIGVVDLTPFYCGPRFCFAVIGGVLVHSDDHHVTALFNSTLAPYLMRALDRGQWLDR